MKFPFPAQCGSVQVYMSLCVFAHKLKKTKNFKISLPPRPVTLSLHVLAPLCCAPLQVTPSSDFSCVSRCHKSSQLNHEKKTTVAFNHFPHQKTLMSTCMYVSSCVYHVLLFLMFRTFFSQCVSIFFFVALFCHSLNLSEGVCVCVCMYKPPFYQKIVVTLSLGLTLSCLGVCHFNLLALIFFSLLIKYVVSLVYILF